MSPRNCEPHAADAADALLPLAELAVGRRGQVRDVKLEAREVDWLRAIGIGAGERVTIVRRALFGGPLHVRTGCGGEFAIDRSLARAIQVEPDADGRPAAR